MIYPVLSTSKLDWSVLPWCEGEDHYESYEEGVKGSGLSSVTKVDQSHDIFLAIFCVWRQSYARDICTCNNEENRLSLILLLSSLCATVKVFAGGRGAGYIGSHWSDSCGEGRRQQAGSKVYLSLVSGYCICPQ